MYSIETKKLTKKFKDKIAVNGIDLNIKQGELFALLGTNGAGKTTTIKMLSGLILPTSGSIKILDMDMKKDIFKIKEILNVSPQETAIAPNLTVKGSWLVPAAIVRPMVDKSMNRLPQMSLASLKTQAEAMKATIETDVTFGAQLISPEQERAILWDGSSQLTNVMLPYKNVNGRITPNFDLLLNFNNFQEELKKHPNISNFEKSSLMRKYGLTGEDVVEKDGVFELKNTMMFLTFSAYADDDNIDFTDTTERFTEDVSNAEGVRIKDMFNNAVKYGNVTPTKSQKASAVGGYDKARRWDFRKGNVFIPIKSAYLGDHMSMNQYVSKDMMNRFDVRSQLATEMAQAPTISGQFS